MKATELRIGNYVEIDQYPNDRVIIKIEDGTHIDQAIKLNASPILLTDEWFDKWGFHKDGEYWCMGIYDYKFCFRYRDWAKNWAFYQEYTDSPNPKDDGIKYPISFDLEYVHQLQNLWFSLLHFEIIDTKD